MRRGTLSVAALLLGLLWPAALQTAPLEMAVRTRLIDQFRIGRDQRDFGPFTFVGGLELVASHRNFGGFSALRFMTPGARFVGVADTGFWYFGRIERNAEGRPIGIADFTMEPITGPDGEAASQKTLIDAEGLAIADGIATVSFEREHRVSEYRLQPGAMGRQIRDLDFLIPRRELRQNRGMETVLAAPASSIFGKTTLVLGEMSLNPKGDIFAAVLGGPRKGVFFVARSNEFDITDGAFLGNGDLLILERKYSMMAGVAMRIRRLAAADIRPGATVDGPVLIEADMGYQIDNMEGMDVWTDPQGRTRVSLISDDNTSFLQRNLYLEFIYDPK